MYFEKLICWGLLSLIHLKNYNSLASSRAACVAGEPQPGVDQPEVQLCETEPFSGGKAHLHQGSRLIFSLRCNVTSSERYFRSRNVTKRQTPHVLMWEEWTLRPIKAKIAQKYSVIFYQNSVVLENSLSTEIVA